MTVYVVMLSWHDVDSIDGVFASKQLAEKHIEKRKFEKRKHIDYYEWRIREHKVIGE